MNKALNLLGLMRKANAIRIGEEDTGSAVREHAAKLVLRKLFFAGKLQKITDR